MSFLVQVCHPSEYIQNSWDEVARTSDLTQAMDHLSSPAFDWRRGLLVRVTSDIADCPVFIGVFGEDRCVDIGPTSEITQNFWIDSVVPLREFIGMNFLQSWISCDKPIPLIKWMDSHINYRRLVEIFVSYFDAVVPEWFWESDITGDKNLYRVIEAMRCGQNFYEMAESIEEEPYCDGRYGFYRAQRSVRSMCRSDYRNAFSEMLYYSGILRDLSSTHGDMCNKKLVDIIRKEISITEIAENIGR